MTPYILPIKKQGTMPSVIVKSQDKNAKPHIRVGNHATASNKAKDKGKANLNDNGQDKWETIKKPINLQSRPMQSRHWNASSPLPGQTSSSSEGLLMKGWLQAVKKHIPVCEDEKAFAAQCSFEDMQPMQADV